MQGVPVGSAVDRSGRFAVIGAGPVGLGLARALKARGIPYEQLEADAEVGGNWRHGVYETAHIISSKRTTEFADFPMPAHYPDFPSAAQMVAYLQSYARHFELYPHIQFGTKVVMARPLPDARWEVELAGGERRTYKGLVVCSGHHWDRRWPSYPGRFTGELIHSKDYRSPAQLLGKRVLVIGGGNSACDIASEAARVAKRSELSLRRGYWFLPKTAFGRPLVELVPGWMPVWAQRILLRGVLAAVVGDYRRYGLPRPDHRIFEHHPTINSELLHYLRHGRITPRPDVARFDGEVVRFVDGSSAEFDLVVAATGYHVSFPFLPPGLVAVKGSCAQLYAGTVLPDVKNLYVVGTGQPRYGFGPLVTPGAELIARMIAMQDRMELPIGLVLKELGVKIPRTHLMDPHAALREMRRARVLLPLLVPRKERKLHARKAAPPPRELEASVPSDPNLRVF